MKVSYNPEGGLSALEELRSCKVGVLLQIIEWLDEMDLSVGEIETILGTCGLNADCAIRCGAEMRYGKGVTSKADEMHEEPSIEVRQECAMIYIEKMRKRNIEPAVEDIVNKYLISEEMARASLSQEPLNEQGEGGVDVFPHRKFT
jgi:hypothetical protein